MKGLCDKCKRLYEQESSNISDYCLHCKELVLKSFYINNISDKEVKYYTLENDNAEND